MVNRSWYYFTSEIYMYVCMYVCIRGCGDAGMKARGLVSERKNVKRMLPGKIRSLSEIHNEFARVYDVTSMKFLIASSIQCTSIKYTKKSLSLCFNSDVLSFKTFVSSSISRNTYDDTMQLLNLCLHDYFIV